MTHITVSVKFLNGELLEIQHKSSRGFDHFIRILYQSCEFIPYGCLVLKRLPSDDSDLDETAQLMRLPDIYSSLDNDEVTEVYDGDELMAIIDTTLVTPYIVQESNVALPSSKRENQQIVFVYSITFRSIHDPRESQTIVFHDTEKGLFALCDTFILPTPQEASEYHRDGLYEVYKPTPQTMWFPTLSECLLSSADRFPHDSHTLQIIEKQFYDVDWTQWSQQDDDGIDYEYDYQYDPEY